jgi:glycerol-3-phosphate dehydrogenase
MKINRTVVLGAGNWGTALAILWAQHGQAVTLWGHNPEKVARLRSTRENPHLSGAKLPAGIDVTHDLADCAGAERFGTPPNACARTSRMARCCLAARKESSMAAGCE